MKINNVKQTMGLVNKTLETKSIYPENLQRIFSNLQGDFKSVKDSLSKNAEEIITNVYKIDNHLIIPADKYLCELLDISKLFYSNANFKSILEFKGTLPLENESALYIFAPKKINENLIKYNKKNVTDAAKTDYYRDIKGLIEEGKFDASELLNENLWYATKSGDRIFTLNPYLDGYTAMRDREPIAKLLFNKLFN